MPTSNSPIKIVFAVNTTVRAGVEEHVLSFLKKLDPHKYETYLLTTPPLFKALAHDLSTLPAKIITIDIKGKFDVKSFWKIYQTLIRIKPDILHSHMFITGFYYSPLGKLAGIPVIVETVHGIERHRAEKKPFGKSSFLIDRFWSLFTNAYIGVSHACSREMESLKRIKHGKINTIHNGRNLEHFTPPTKSERIAAKESLGINSQTFVFGTIARLDYQKGHIYLLNAVSQLKGKIADFYILLVGNGPLEKTLKKEADKLGLSNHIIWAGFQSDTKKMLSAMDVHVLPSLYEGLPLVAIEAMAVKTPMIATSVDGTPEIIINNKTGLLVKEKDSDQLYIKMLWSYNNYADFQKLTEAGYQFVRNNFTEDIQIAKTIDLYHHLLMSHDE